MKTKIFAYEVERGRWVLATARIINRKGYVNYCYATDVTTPVAQHHLPHVVDIQLWCEGCDAIIWAY